MDDVVAEPVGLKPMSDTWEGDNRLYAKPVLLP